MDWAALIVALVKSFLSLATSGVEYLKDKQLIDAGAAQAILASLQQAQEGIQRAKAIRAAVRAGAASDPAIVRGVDDGAKRKS